ncbi:MAG: hypothetical protein AAGI66_10035 [Cyanobacteria bacterium P01_H01_bin.74]
MTKQKDNHDSPKERSTYDELMRDNIIKVLVPAAEALLELTMENPQPYLTDIVSYTKREPDYVSRFIDKDGDYALLHLELQTDDDKAMVHRMRQYQYMYESRFELPMRQYCIYLGQKPSKMATQLKQRIPKATNNYTYNLVELRNYSYRFFLKSGIPEMVLLAILGDPGHDAPERIIAAILGKLQRLAESTDLLEKYVNQLNTLSKLRNLQKETLKQIKAMPIHFDINDDVLYQEGKAEGKDEREEGIILSMLKKRKFSTQEIAHLIDIAVDKVQAVRDKHNL